MRLKAKNKALKPSNKYSESIIKKTSNTNSNQKVRNAQKCSYNGIAFRSNLELYCYKMLELAKLPFEYEKRTYITHCKNKLTTTTAIVYSTSKKSETKPKVVSKRVIKTLQQTTYTPDFTMETDDYVYIIETKGNPNDAYPLRRKMFLSEMENTSSKPVIFLEPHNQSEVKECIYDIIQHLKYVKNKKMLKTKELSDLALAISEEEYRKLPAWSYSNLSAYDREGVKGLTDEVKSTISLLKGSLLDTMLTDQAKLEQLFFKYDGKVPEGNLLDIASQMLEFDKEWEYFTADQLKALARANNYGADNWKPETIKEKLKDAIKPYVDAMRVAGNRAVISEDIYQECLAMQEKMLKKFYMFFRQTSEHPHIVPYHQLKFMTDYKGIPIRCMFDSLVVNYADKIIIPADLKTTYYNESDFLNSMLKYRYFYQGFMYTWILKKILKSDPYFKDFTVLPFRFIVISSNTMNPFMYILEDSNLDDYVMPEIKDGYKIIRPWQELLIDLEETVKAKRTYKTTENNGLLYVKVLNEGGINVYSKNDATK